MSIFNKKNGSALSPVKGDFCAMCHMRIRPQMLNEIRDRNKIHLCENCGRILYWVTKPE
jgi:predicted  nucleic acid-binding Zn-ribbon protein